MDEVKQLAEEFRSCQKLLTAIGDENRLHLMVEMTHLSRPAVSHHLQILREAGILGMRKDGTKNYYYFDSDHRTMKQLIAALQHAVDIASALPDREE